MRGRSSFCGVTCVARLLALWLAALWLPLTMHCQLVSLMNCGEGDTCSKVGAMGQAHYCNGEACHHESDTCNIIESGNYFLNKPASQAASDSTGSLVHVDSRSLLPPVAILNATTGAPPGWNRIWQFVFRAAPAARAPVVLG